MSQDNVAKIQELVQQYVANQKMNKFMGNNPDCKNLIKGGSHVFLVNMTRISNELTPLIHEEFHGKPVKLPNGNYGIIKHELVSYYNGKEFITSTPFRNEEIAVWVVAENKKDTRLYRLSELMVGTEKDLVELNLNVSIQ